MTGWTDEARRASAEARRRHAKSKTPTKPANQPTNTSTAARNLAVGDVVHPNPKVSWRVESIDHTTDKAIHYHAITTKCDFAPSRIGNRHAESHRLDTTLKITRHGAK